MNVLKSTFLVVALVLSGCGGNNNIDRKTAGWIGGGAGLVLGGWTGSQFGAGTGEFIMTALGAVVGGSMGYDAGRRLALADRQSYNNAVETALNDNGQYVTWQNDTTGTSGYVTSGSHFRDANGRSCQMFRSTIAFIDVVQNGSGTACREMDGEWVLVADTFR